jgi:hypothetical protein
MKKKPSAVLHVKFHVYFCGFLLRKMLELIYQTTRGYQDMTGMIIAFFVGMYVGYLLSCFPRNRSDDWKGI